MKTLSITTLSLLGAAVLAACSSLPEHNAMLERARSDYHSAQADGQTQALASAELRQAGEALALANAASARGDDTAKINHLSYLTRQRVALAQEAAQRKSSEAAVVVAGAERDRLRLDSRTREADQAKLSAAAATRDAAASQRASDASQRQAMLSQRDAAASQQQAGEAERRAQALEQQLRDLDAKKTARGLVVTIGDVLFDTGRAELKSGGLQNVQRLSGFLKEYPQRAALIEGYTDSVGSDDLNMALSARRADAVLAALLRMGVSRKQLSAQGYGETYPVAGNDSSGGRQMNRRVEIVLSDENGVVTPR